MTKRTTTLQEQAAIHTLLPKVLETVVEGAGNGGKSICRYKPGSTIHNDVEAARDVVKTTSGDIGRLSKVQAYLVTARKELYGDLIRHSGGVDRQAETRRINELEARIERLETLARAAGIWED